MMKEQQKPRKVSSFDNVNCFVAFHDAVSLKRIPTQKIDLNVNQKKALQTFFMRFRQHWQLPVGEIRNVIQFAYMHNPCRYTDLRAYGDREKLHEVAPHYIRWRYQQKSLIAKHGISKAITLTIDERTETDDMLEELMQGLLGDRA